jgi:hypothetical protein
MRLGLLGACALFAATIGCSGGGDFAPVSGVVTLDGKPYSKAAVSFQPVGDKDNPYPGRGSSAYTDENGRYVLTSDNTTDGAVVGKHLVRITTRYDQMPGEPGVGSPDNAALIVRRDPIPVEWNAESKVQFDVPPGGTDEANFDIKTKK